MQAIVTRYLPQTSTRPRRIVAEANAGKIVVRWDSSLHNDDDQHRAAMQALVDKKGWRGEWIMGAMPDGVSGVFVCLPKEGKP